MAPSFTDPRTGVTWTAESDEDLLKLYRQVMQLDAPAAPGPKDVHEANAQTVAQVPSGNAWKMFDDGLSAEARQLLLWAKRRGEQPFEVRDAQEALPQLERSAVGGIISGIRRRSKKILGSDVAVLRRHPKRGQYVIGSALAVHDVQPPTVWDRLGTTPAHQVP